MKPEHITPSRFTIESLENLKKCERGYQAHCCDQRIRFLESETKRTFVELGLIVLFVEENELWKELCDDDGNPYRSSDHWVTEACPSSRSHAFAAKAAVKVFRENNLPIEQVERIPQKNIKHLKELSTSVMHNPEVLKQAETLPELEFVQAIQKSHPDQLRETTVPLRLNPTCSQRAIYDKVFQQAAVIYETNSREELLEYILQEWAESHVEERAEAANA